MQIKLLRYRILFFEILYGIFKVLRLNKKQIYFQKSKNSNSQLILGSNNHQSLQLK